MDLMPVLFVLLIASALGGIIGAILTLTLGAGWVLAGMFLLSGTGPLMGFTIAYLMLDRGELWTR